MQQRPNNSFSKNDFTQLIETLREFVSLPSISPNDYPTVCSSYLERAPIISIFASLLYCPEEFDLISAAILKFFESPIGNKLLRDQHVCEWLIGGLKQYKDESFEHLNLLSIRALSSAIKNEQDLLFVINNHTLFDSTLQLVHCKFESSFQLLEQMIQKHSKSEMLLKKLLAKDGIYASLSKIKKDTMDMDIDRDDEDEKMDKDTVAFRVHTLWIAALVEYCKNDTDKEALNDYKAYPSDFNANKIHQDKKKTNNSTNVVSEEHKQETQETTMSDAEMMKLYEQQGYFQNLLELLQSDDLLIRVNVLPLLGMLACVPQGVALLLRNNTLEPLHQLLSSELDLVSKQIYKVLYTMSKTCSRKHDELFDTFFNTYDTLTQMIQIGMDSNDIFTRESCILLIGVLCSHAQFLYKFSAEKQLDILAAMIKNSSEKVSEEEQFLVIASLHALSDVFSYQSKEKTDVEKIQSGLIEKFGGIEKLFAFIQLPFDDLRFGAFRLLNEIAKHPWTLQAVYSSAGLYEYLTNRKDLDIKLAMEWKYAVLQTISQNAMCSKVLTTTHQEQLKEYLKQGVVFNTGGEYRNKNQKTNRSAAVKIGWNEDY